VAWKKRGDIDHNIYLYSNGNMTRVTHYQNDYGMGTIFDLWQNSLTEAKTKFAPHMNNKGEIVWVTRIPNASNPSYWDMAVNAYNEGQITELNGWTVIPNAGRPGQVSFLRADAGHRSTMPARWSGPATADPWCPT
jgi:hypothetical protein